MTPDATASPPITSQIQSALTSLLGGAEAAAIKPGHYIVLIDTSRSMSESNWDCLQETRIALAAADIHLHLVPLDNPKALTFIEVAPALAQFAAEDQMRPAERG